MAQTIKVKRSTDTAVPPSLAKGELAYSSNSDKLFIGNPSDAAVDIIGGKYYTGFFSATAAAMSANTASKLVLRDASGNFAAGTITGNITSAGTSTFTTIDVNGGAIDGTTIGSAVASTGAFTTISATGTTTGVAANYTGAVGIDGNFDINTNKFTVAAATGNTAIAGTLDATGAVGIDGNFDIATNKFTVAAATGNTAIAGTLNTTGLTTGAAANYSGAVGIDGNFDIATNKFTVAAATGNTVIAGSLTVTGGGDFDITGDVDGNAATATKLAAAVNIQGVAFDGSSAVTVVTAGTGVTVTGTEVKIGQAVATTDNVTFNNVTVDGTLTSDDITAATMTASGHVVVQGNLTVNGTTTTVNSNTVAIGDAVMELNSDLGAGVAPSVNAGFEVNRGSATDVSLLWNEGNDNWTVSDGSVTAVILTASNFNEVYSGIIDGGDSFS